MPGFFPEAPEFFPPPLMGGAFPPEGPAFRGGFGRGMRGGYAGQPGGMYDRPPYGAGGFYDGSPDMEFDGYGGYARGRGFARPYPGPPRSGVRDTEEPRSSSASRRDESRDYDARSSVHEDAAERESVTDRPKAEVASNAPESLNGAAATSETPVDAAPKPEDVHADRRASARRPSDAGSGYYSHRDRHHGYSEDRGYYDHSRRGGYPPYDQHHPGREYEKYDRPDKYEKYGKYGYDRDYYGRDRESRRPEASSSVYVKERDYSRDREKDYSGSRRDGSRSRDKDRSERRSRKSSRERRGDRERDQEDRRRDEDYPLEAEPKLEENETQPMDGMKQEQSPEPSGTPRRLSISSAVSQGDRDREKESRSSSRSHRKRRPSKSPSRSRSRSRSVDEDRRKRRRERRERKDKDRERRHRRRRDRDGERDDKDRERDDRERV
ncbi:hypothetical protein BC832DRAFT_126403 [Gaertneriomyces semiglobifer]|nr:hypothetical protein BC832DRAFT_126403 [Gaertneriomyces semiglobifer]